MDGDDSNGSRRLFLRLTGSASLLGLAGCLGGGGHGGEDHPEEIDLDAPVPDSDVNCTSIDGHERNPDDLRSKEDAAYQHHPQGYQLCANCQFFCPGSTDEVGACTEVAGRIRSQHWCALYQPTERLNERPPDEIDFGGSSSVSQG